MEKSSGEMQVSKKVRDCQMDNIKAFLLFLVALGHTLDVYKDSGEVELYLMKYIYLFHMPLFAFITGYFTKDLEKARSTALEKCLIPYLLIQGLYILMATVMIRLGLANFNSSVFNSSLLVPSSAFYYLLAVFFWKLLAKDILRLRYPLFFSVLLGLLVSVTRMNEFHVGYGAVFSLLPFFVLGVLCSPEMLRKIKRIPKAVAVLVLALGMVPAIFLPYAIHSVRMTYSSVGFHNIEGILYRLLFYAIAVMLGIAILCLASERKTWYTHIGRASILVYAGSTFLAPHAYVILDRIFSLSENRFVNLLGMVCFSLAVVFFCAIPVFLKWYNAVLEWIQRLIFKRTDVK